LTVVVPHTTPAENDNPQDVKVGISRVLTSFSPHPLHSEMTHPRGSPWSAEVG
jgi:hypothetical protein